MSRSSDTGAAASLEPTVLGALSRYRLLAAAIVLAAVVAAVGLSVRSSRSYSATMDVIVRDPRTTQVFDTQSANSPERYVADQAAVLRSTNVATRVVELAGQQNPPIHLTLDEVTSSTSVATDPSSSQISVSYGSPDADDALKVANLFLKAYEDVRSEAATADTQAALDQLDTTIAGIDKQLLDLNTQITNEIQAGAGSTDLQATTRAALEAINRASANGDSAGLNSAVSRFNSLVAFNTALRENPSTALLISQEQQLADRRATLVSRRDEIQVDAQLATSGVVLSSPAVEAHKASGDSMRLLLAGLVLGGMLAAGVTYLLSLRRFDFTDRRQPESVLGVPLVADVPEYIDPNETLPIVVAPTSVEAEAYRFAAASLRVLVADQKSAVVAVVSASVGEGKSSLTANMAIALAEDGVRVAVVDADLARHGITSLLLGANESPIGLREVLDGTTHPAEALRRVQPWPMAPTFDLLAAGQSDVAERTILPGPLSRILAALRESHDIVLVDTPPLLQVASASMIVSLVDSVIAVVAHGSPVSRANDVAERIAMSDARLIGYVYNKNRNRAGMPTYYVVPDGAPSKRQAWSRR